MTEPLELRVHSDSKASAPRLDTLCQALSRTAQMCQATLSEPLPGLLDEVPIADEDTRPGRNAVRQRALGAVGVYLAIGDEWLGHAPQPAPAPTGAPRGRVNVMHQRGACDLSNGCVVGHDRCRDALHHVLDRPLAQRSPAHGGTQILYCAAARSHDTRHLPDAARQPWAIATDLVGRDGGFAALAAGQALPWVEPPVGHLRANDGQLNHLLGVIGA